MATNGVPLIAIQRTFYPLIERRIALKIVEIQEREKREAKSDDKRRKLINTSFQKTLFTCGRRRAIQGAENDFKTWAAPGFMLCGGSVGAEREA